MLSDAEGVFSNASRYNFDVFFCDGPGILEGYSINGNHFEMVAIEGESSLPASSSVAPGLPSIAPELIGKLSARPDRPYTGLYVWILQRVKGPDKRELIRMVLYNPGVTSLDVPPDARKQTARRGR